MQNMTCVCLPRKRQFLRFRSPFCRVIVRALVTEFNEYLILANCGGSKIRLISKNS